MPLVTEELLDAISQVESGNDPKAIGDTGLRNKAFGAFQIRLPAFKDVQRLFPQEFGEITFEQIKRDPTLNRLTAKRYLEALESHYGITDVDRLISGFNAGPSARRGAIRNPNYVNKVKQQLRGEGNDISGGDKVPGPRSRVDPIEEGVRRIFQMTVAAGFKPLSTQDIEQILEKVEPPRAMPGVKQPNRGLPALPGSRVLGDSPLALGDSHISNSPARPGMANLQNLLFRGQPPSPLTEL